MSRKINNLVGQRFGRLIVLGDSGTRTRKGSVLWSCQCDCGNAHISIGSNLRHGSTSSCGCFALECSSKLGKSQKLPQPGLCTFEGCKKVAHEFERTLCTTHAKRKRLYGDASFVTAESVRVDRQRTSLLANAKPAKGTTYKKLFGMHEHRRIGILIAGRPLEKWEHVHHIDGDKHNNHPSNLMILTATEHAALHMRQKNA